MPFYLLHMTASTLTGFFVIQLDAPVAAKYALIVMIATALTLLVYEFAVRRWNPARLVFGMRPMSRGSAPESVQAGRERQGRLQQQQDRP
jgi:hypothetical protein